MNNTLSNNDKILQSPCIGKCGLDDNNICAGCFRALAEIVDWANSRSEEKAAILAQCQLRKTESLNNSSAG